MSPFWSIVFITLGLLLTSLVEGPPFEDECDDSSFDAAFYNRSTLLILKNPYLYTWRRDSKIKEEFRGKLIKKEHRYKYWPEIDDRITAACSVYKETAKVQMYIFMNDKMMYFYADQFNKKTQFWESSFWEHSFEEIPNHEYFVPTCLGCDVRVTPKKRRQLISATLQFVNSDLTEIRHCTSKAMLENNSFMAQNPNITCNSYPAPKSKLVIFLDKYLKKKQPCLHFAEGVYPSGKDIEKQEPTLIFTGNTMFVHKIKWRIEIVPVDRTLFGCDEPPSFLFEFTIGLILWIIAVLTTLLPLCYFLLTNPREDDSRSHSKGKGQDDQVEVKESMEEKDERFILEPLSPLRQRINLQRFRQPVGEEDTIRTIISTG